jgi:hypothetical protein
VCFIYDVSLLLKEEGFSVSTKQLFLPAGGPPDLLSNFCAGLINDQTSVF